MTFEEMQQIIEGMLRVQRQIQENQLKHDEKIAVIDERLARITEKMDNLTENVENLNTISQRHENRLTYLYGYDMQAEANLLDIRQKMLNLERRVGKIERDYFSN